MLPLALNWPLSSVTGYGNYGLQILMQYLRRGGHEFVLTDQLILPIVLPVPFDKTLAPMLEKACAPARFLDTYPNEILHFQHPVLHGVGNSFSLLKNQLRVKGHPNIACAAIEEAICPAEWLPFLKIYDRFISISRWNKDFLSSLNLAPVYLCHQGIDTNLFYPAVAHKRQDGPFVIFSGGKFEFRKGQDIVVAAFKRFREKYKNAFLITAWQSRHISDPAPFIQAGHCQNVPRRDASGEGLALTEWLVQQGLPLESFKALPYKPNLAMPDILRGCDVAIFPNRCEGGTNLVAMEALACGVPTYVSYNTGQKDLVDLIGSRALTLQRPVKAVHGIESVQDWGESDVDEVVAVLEQAYARNADDLMMASVVAEKMKKWDWSHQNDKLLDIVYK